MSEQNHYVYEFGPFRLDAQKRLLWREGAIVPLKPKAFETLLALVGAGGQVVEKDELMRRVWPNTTVEEGNLTFNISSLRKALGDDPRRHEYIVTIPGEGYQFVAGVRAKFDELVVHESTSITVEEEEDGETTIADSGLRIADLSRDTKALPASTREPLERSEQLASNPPSAIGKPQSYRSVALLVGVAVIVIGTAAAYGIYWLVSQRQARDSLTEAVPFREISISRLTTSGKIRHAAISPDGKYVAHVTADAQGDPGVDKSRWRIGIVSSESGPPVHRFDFPPTVAPAGRFVRWSPDSQSIAYVNNPGGVSDIWLQPLNGSPPRRLTDFKAEQIISFDWSRDGKSLAVIRGVEDSDAVLIGNASLKR